MKRGVSAKYLGKRAKWMPKYPASASSSASSILDRTRYALEGIRTEEYRTGAFMQSHGAAPNEEEAVQGCRKYVSGNNSSQLLIRWSGVHISRGPPI